MALDIVPALLEKIQADFARRAETDPTLCRLLRRIEDGTAELAEVHDYAEQLGRVLSKSLLSVLTEEALPDGRLYWNIADRTIRPMLEGNYHLTDEAAKAVQKSIDKAAGIGLNAVSATLPTERIKGIVDKAVEEETLTEARKWLGEPIINCTESFFDDFVETNADFRYRAGMFPKIVRTVVGNCCDWCASLAGTYDYANVKSGGEVFRRHQFCRCKVTFVNGSKRQSVWSKKAWEESPETLNARKIVGIDQTAGADVTPEYFGTATPGRGKISYEPEYDQDLYHDEVKIARWLHDTFGGDIMLLNEAKEDGQKRADYLWRGKLWDLKTTGTVKAADAAIRKGLKQIRDNPGGIILDYGDREIPLQTLKGVIADRMKFSGDKSVDVIIISKTVKVYRYKK